MRLPHQLTHFAYSKPLEDRAGGNYTYISERVLRLIHLNKRLI